MTIYDNFKKSYFENEKYIKKAVLNKAPKAVLGDDAVLVLKYLVGESKKKIDNKPSDLRSFSRHIYIPVNLLKDAIGLTSSRQLKALKVLQASCLVRVFYRKDEFKKSTSRTVEVRFEEFKDFCSRCKKSPSGYYYDEPEEEEYEEVLEEKKN